MTSDALVDRRTLMNAAAVAMLWSAGSAAHAQGAPGALPAPAGGRSPAAPPPGFAAKRFVSPNGTLSYTEGPDNGQTLLFLPGMGVPRQSYHPAAALLSDHFHVVLLDQRGQGESDWAADGRYRVVDYGADLVAFIAGPLRGRKVIVSGHSLGGLVALWLASRHPELTAGLNAEDNPFLMSERGYWEGHWVKPLFEAQEARLRAFQASGRDPAALGRHFADERAVMPRQDVPYLQRVRALGKQLSILTRRGVLPADAAEQARLDAAYARWLAGEPLRNRNMLPAGVLAAAPAMSATMDPRVPHFAVTAELNDGFPHRAAMAAVRAPTLYWNSDQDLVGVLSQREHDENVAVIGAHARVRHVVADGVGHLIHAEQPEFYARELAGFFAGACISPR
jgi:pimeloyl-ACP methyl ester carboxylesterase